MQQLPPQLKSAPDGLHALVVQLPRAQLSAKTNLKWAALWIVAALAIGLQIIAATGRVPWLMLTLGLMVEVLAFYYGGLAAFGRHDACFEVRLEASRIAIDEVAIPYGELKTLTWNCAAPVTTLVLVGADGSTTRYPCVRRGRTGGRGVTRKQREWLAQEVATRIERAGGRAAVPQSLSDLQHQA